MSTEHVPLHQEVVRFLETCQGRGAVVVAMPAGDAAHHHHFYAGVSRAPAVSFLEALLLALGGDLEDGERRYQEIVVANAGRASSEGELDKPAEEVIRLRSAEGWVERGGDWGTWWYRRPPADTSPETQAEEGNRPDPLGKVRGQGRRDRWSGIAKEQSPTPEAGADFPHQISATEGGLEFPQRYDALRRIIGTLEGRSHRTLLLLELAVLDYASPELAPQAHVGITDPGFKKMDWFGHWIDDRSGKPGHLDVVLYSRNRGRVEAFLSTGLPRRPPHLQGTWRAVAYRGQNVVRIEYPCGPFPWGERLFSNDRGFLPQDGTSGDTRERRTLYANRTLKAMLRGQEPGGGITRIRFASARPVPPPHPAASAWIDREFWSRIDAPLLRQVLRQDYFGADENRAVKTLVETIEFMQRQARSITDPESFHHAVKDRWMQASSIFLWGEGGMGKSFLGKLLAPLLYGRKDPLLFSCQEAGGGGAGDPVSVFRSRFFGSPPGYVGSERLTEAGRHVVETQGFTVIVFDEANKIAPNDFVNSMEVLYGLLQDRRYLPSNSSLTGDEPVHLWNTIFLLTANLDAFPPPDVPQQNREAITRRVSAHQIKRLDEESTVTFAQWHLPRAVEEALGGVTVCTCGDLSQELVRRRLEGRNPDKLRKELAPFVAAAREDLEQSGMTVATAPLVLDVTDVLRRALR